jgi:hypothetical protein
VAVGFTIDPERLLSNSQADHVEVSPESITLDGT